ncbi:MAG: excinuclease ABC subunit B [Marivita sp.]|uniref:excinuclease ABC subunit B n=1 Tax=Marivita sp. TaxID=2003365 RepID=UPI003EF7AA6D
MKWCFAPLVALSLTGPAAAWDFSLQPICTLSHRGQEMDVTVTFDPALAEYALHLTRPGGWPEAPVFSLRFEGAAGQTISTSRHVITLNTLTVRDSGFGNVLDGLAFNSRAVAVLGALNVGVDLEGATAEVAAFRECPSDQIATVPMGTKMNKS